MVGPFAVLSKVKCFSIIEAPMAAAATEISIPLCDQNIHKED